MTTKTEGTRATAYTWDLRNRMASIDTNGDAVADVIYAYDHEGVRVAKADGGQGSFYLIDRQNLTGYAKAIEEAATQGGVPSSLISWATAVIGQASATGELEYLLHDGRGDTRLLTDAAGVVLESYAFERLPRAPGIRCRHRRDDMTAQFVAAPREYSGLLAYYHWSV